MKAPPVNFGRRSMRGNAVPTQNVNVNVEGGNAFARFMVAPESQKVIGDFGKDKYGQPLFFPDAGKREEEVG